MAITHDYCDFATGNDYKGASFVDGAYTSATKTLVKANAFAASKVNHWLYLESNDGGSIVAGYYRIATWTDASTVILATDAGAGVDDDAAKCTQHDGSTTLPWRSLQGAFDLCTRNTTDGNQVNLKAGTAQVNSAALDLTTFVAGGALSRTAPLSVRGYTSAVNDGGVGEIDCGGATMWAGNYGYFVLVDLNIHNGGNNNLIALYRQSVMFRCAVHKGASSPSGKYLVTTDNSCVIVGNHIYDPGAGNARNISCGSGSLVAGNYVVGETSAGSPTGIVVTGGCVVCNNIVHMKDALAATGINMGGTLNAPSLCYNNACYSEDASTNSGVLAANPEQYIYNNIICGWSGVGGDGVAVANVEMLGYNAFWNNTNPSTVSDMIYLDLTAADVTLAADPFTDAANGDFSLTAAAKAALAGKGWPTSYLGAHANTVPNLNIGPIQMAASAGGGGRPAFGDRTGGKF